MANLNLSSYDENVNQKAGSSKTSKSNFDFIVIGLGSMGSSTCFNLAARGYTVLGLEQFGISHENGSHTGQSRLIRQAYYEHPDYVPLLKKAYKGWDELEKRSNSKLFYKTGILYSGKADDFLISGSIESAAKHGLNIETIGNNDKDSRFPQFKLPSHFKSIFEPNAGFVTPERAILTYIDEAIKSGAEIRSQEPVLSWSENDDSVIVTTGERKYSAKKLIITGGGWSSSLLSSLNLRLKVTKQVITWVNTKSSKPFELGSMPCWGINQQGYDGLFYGFPILDEHEFGGPLGLKIGYHFPGEPVEPDDYSRDVKQADKDIITGFMEKFMPDTFASFQEIKTCLYTNSVDDHFIIDHHPDHKNVVFATGFSGHGFKFIPAIGQALADLTVKGETDLPINFLSLSRFQSTI